MRALLSIETATAEASCAWLVEGEVVRSERLPPMRSEGRSLAEAVRDLAGGQLASAAAYALSIGPGSFTGLRVGLAFVKGLALALPRPVIPISTLALVAAAHEESLPVLAVLDARGGEVYAGLYRGGAPDARLPDGLYRFAELAPRLGAEPIAVAGDAIAALVEAGALPIGARAVLPGSAPLAERLGRMAWARLEEGVEAIDLEPAYHQRAAAERKMVGETSAGDPSPSR